MSALRLVAVYAGSCLLALWLARRHVSPISRWYAAALLLLPLLLTGRAVFTGGFYGPLNFAYQTAPLHSRANRLPRADYSNGHLSDVAIQMVPWRKAVREAVKTGHVPLWNRFLLSGDVLLAASQPAALHPRVWIGFLLPLSTAWTFSCAFTLFLAALTMFLYLRELALREESALFGAAAWMLSNGVVTLQGWPHSNALAPLPLLVLGLRRLARGDRGGFTAVTTSLVLMGLGGHPETMLLAASAAGVLFLFELAGSRRRFPAVARSFGGGLLAAGLTAAALLPFLEALPQTHEKLIRDTTFAHAKKSVPVKTTAKCLLPLLYPRAYDDAPDILKPSTSLSFALIGYGYAGGLALALAAAGVASRRREKRGLLTILAASALVSTGFPGVTDAIARLPVFDIAILEYFILVAGFALAALAALGLDHWLSEDAGRARRAGALFHFLATGALLAIGLWWRWRLASSGAATAAQDLSVVLAVSPALIFGVLALVLRKSPGAAAVCAFVLLAAARVIELPRLYETFPANLFYPPDLEELRSLPRAGAPYRTVGLGYSMVPNQSALWELEDPRGYEAMTNLRYLETYPLWCVNQPVWFNRVDDPSRTFLSFLNVRFAVGEPGAAVPPGWKPFAGGEHCAIFENPNALARAFAPERVRFVAPSEDAVSLMWTCRDFSKTAWIEASSGAGAEQDNGRAGVAVTRDGPDLLLEITASSPAWIVASETAWKGWKAYVDGARTPISIANHAFLAFRVSAGKHRARLVYRPDSFAAGLAISGASLLVAAGLALRASIQQRAMPAAARGASEQTIRPTVH